RPRNVRAASALAPEDAPNPGAAEFFINLADNLRLDHHADDAGNATGYTVFGRVVSGMDVVDKIASVQLGDGGPMPGAWPLAPVPIRRGRPRPPRGALPSPPAPPPRS